MRLLGAIGLRLLFGAVSLVLISFVTFVADELAPGDRATIEAGEKARPETIAALRAKYHLDDPWPMRYAQFVGSAARLDFGNSYVGTKQPVTNKLRQSTPITVEIALLAITLAALVGITLGVFAAIWQNRWPDATVLTISTLGVTLPTFVLAPVLVYLFSNVLDRLPPTYTTAGASEFERLVLPVVILSLRPMALLTRLTRASMIDTLQQEFMRTAQAKGVPFWRRMLRHGLRNAILPVMTAIGTSFGFLLTGSFVLERAFTIPGLGSASIDAILQGDTPMVMATVLLAGAMFVVVNLIVDILLPILDPRIREAQV